MQPSSSVTGPHRLPVFRLSRELRNSMPLVGARRFYQSAEGNEVLQLPGYPYSIKRSPIRTIPASLSHPCEGGAGPGWGDEKSVLNGQNGRGGVTCFCCQKRLLSPRRRSPKSPLPPCGGGLGWGVLRRRSRRNKSGVNKQTRQGQVFNTPGQGGWWSRVGAALQISLHLNRGQAQSCDSSATRPRTPGRNGRLQSILQLTTDH